MNRPEIMAPVGGEEQLKAAVRMGADAVYFGMQNFNARRNADNFAGDGLTGTIAYCHAHAVRVYLTVNTLIKDSELDEMRKAVDTAAYAGADALIVQDLAVAEYVRRAWPKLPLHASTQMAIHNVDGVKILEKYGFSRFVLARELTLEEIRKIKSATNAEIEVFVHGAHCMSVSGNCYLSAMIGGRSGNRGLCAQPCRLDWQCKERGHSLSLKDLSYITHISDLSEAGVSAIKIEGRMKRAEYVAASVLACRNALDGKSADLETLRKVFSRSGFTDGYLTGKRNADMFGYRTKEDVVAADDVLKKLAALYEKEPCTVPVHMTFKALKGEPSSLEVSDGIHSVSVTGDVPQQARKLQLNEEYAARSLEKTGGTMFLPAGLSCRIDEGLMLSASSMNDLRRRALDSLYEQRSRGPEYIRSGTESAPLVKYRPGEDKYRFRFEKASQIFDGLRGEEIILPLDQIKKDPSLINHYPGLIAELPDPLYPGKEEKIKSELLGLKMVGLKAVMADNISVLQMASELDLYAVGGPCLNIMNSVSLDEYRRLGLKDALISFELSFVNMKALKGTLERGFIGYGYLPLMKMRSCPGRTSKGCEKCPGKGVLTDRMGENFTYLCRGKEYSELFNCVPLYVGDRQRPAADYQLLWFTAETRAECQRIYEMYISGKEAGFRKTAGLYFREVL